MVVFVDRRPDVVKIASGGGVAGPDECPDRVHGTGRRCRVWGGGRCRPGYGGSDMASLEFVVFSNTLMVDLWMIARLYHVD